MQITSITAAAQASQSASTAKVSSTGFSDVLNQAMEQVNAAETQSEAVSAELLTGENTDIHTAMIAVQKAELTLNLAIQVRNKVVEAYNEVMRMQV